MIDRVAADLGRRLLEVPVGFKWFVPGLVDGSLGFGGEESAGASFLRRDGTVWTTDKDGIIACLLAAEMTARTGRDPGAAYEALTERFGAPAYRRIDAAGDARPEGRPRPAVARPGLRHGPRRRPGDRHPDDGAGQRGGHRRPQGHDRLTAGSPPGRPAPRTSTRSTRRASAATTTCNGSSTRRRPSSGGHWHDRTSTSTSITTTSTSTSTTTTRRSSTTPRQVEAFRADKDDAFRYSPGSPIPHEVRHDFPGLPYFPVDESLRFEGLTLEPYAGDQPTSFQIPTSDNQLKPAHRAGSFAFELGGEPRRLTAYVIDGGHGDSVFVPFLDATSGHETYGAGRYLDIEPEEDGTYVARLQPRLPPVVRLLALLLVPADPGREPVARPDRGRRTAGRGRWRGRAMPSEPNDRRPQPSTTAYVGLGVAAAVLGVATAVGVWLFNQAFGLVHRVVFDGVADALAPLGAWTLIPIIAAAGIVVALIVRFMRPEPLGALPHVIDGVIEHDGRLNGHNAAVAISGAAAGIGFGMPLGADTPSAMIGAPSRLVRRDPSPLADGIRPGTRRGRRRGRDLVDVPRPARRGRVRVRGRPRRLRRGRVRGPDAHRGRRRGLRHLRAGGHARDLRDPAAGDPLGRDAAPVPGAGDPRRDSRRSPTSPSCSGRSRCGHASRCRRWAGW